MVAQIEPTAGAATAARKSLGTHFVQVASIGDFIQNWAESKTTATYGGLKGLKYRTIAANLGAKGSFTRLQAGPMSKAEADKLCAANQG